MRIRYRLGEMPVQSLKGIKKKQDSIFESSFCLSTTQRALQDKAKFTPTSAHSCNNCRWLQHRVNLLISNSNTHIHTLMEQLLTLRAIKKANAFNSQVKKRHLQSDRQTQEVFKALCSVLPLLIHFQAKSPRAVWGSASCLRTLQQADQSRKGSNPLVSIIRQALPPELLLSQNRVPTPVSTCSTCCHLAKTQKFLLPHHQNKGQVLSSSSDVFLSTKI